MNYFSRSINRSRASNSSSTAMSTTSLRISVSIRSPFERSATPASYPYTACQCRITSARIVLSRNAAQVAIRSLRAKNREPCLTSRVFYFLRSAFQSVSLCWRKIGKRQAKRGRLSFIKLRKNLQTTQFPKKRFPLFIRVKRL